MSKDSVSHSRCVTITEEMSTALGALLVRFLIIFTFPKVKRF